jgi:hypothetical protein
MKIVQDFWQEPSYAALLHSMQTRVHDYVVVGRGTPQEAMDGLLIDWTNTFVADKKIQTQQPLVASQLMPDSVVNQAPSGYVWLTSIGILAAVSAAIFLVLGIRQKVLAVKS